MAVRRKICEISNCNCDKNTKKIYELQEKMVIQEFCDLFDSVMTYRIQMMVESGIPYNESIYEQGNKFFKKCFRKSVKQYFMKEK